VHGPPAADRAGPVDADPAEVKLVGPVQFVPDQQMLLVPSLPCLQTRRSIQCFYLVTVRASSTPVDPAIKAELRG